MSKYDYFIPESMTREEFEAEWKPVAERLKKIFPLRDLSGAPVQMHTQIESIDFAPVADCLTGSADKTGLAKRFVEMAEKKDNFMSVESLLGRPSGEVTRWRKMGNRIALMPNALVLWVNGLT